MEWLGIGGAGETGRGVSNDSNRAANRQAEMVGTRAEGVSQWPCVRASCQEKHASNWGSGKRERGVAQVQHGKATERRREATKQGAESKLWVAPTHKNARVWAEWQLPAAIIWLRQAAGLA